MRFSLRHAVTLAVLATSLPTWASLSEEHMKQRLVELEIYRNNGLDLPAIERQVVYELHDLTPEVRAWQEGQLLARDLRHAVLQSYLVALEESGSAEAAADVIRANMEKDAPLLAPELKDDINALVEHVLANPVPMSSDEDVPLSPALLANMRARGQSQMELLSQPTTSSLDSFESMDNKSSGSSITTRAGLLAAFAGGSREDFQVNYNTVARSEEARASSQTFSAQVSAEFLGVKLAAGPTFNFTQTITSTVEFGGEGYSPLFDAQGRFDLVKRNSQGQPLRVAGVVVPRRVAFSCELEAEVQSETVLAGGFSVAGLGGDARVTRTYKNTVKMASQDLLVPNTLDNRLTTVATLASICQRDYMNVRASNGRTIKQNIDVSIRNLVASLTYRNAAMKCVINSHCNSWYNREVLGIHKYRTVPRCIQERGNTSVMTCQLRGGTGANCAVVRDGKRVSNGYFEYTCDTGKRCVVTKQGGWGGFLNTQWIPWKGECR